MERPFLWETLRFFFFFFGKPRVRWGPFWWGITTLGEKRCPPGFKPITDKTRTNSIHKVFWTSILTSTKLHDIKNHRLVNQGEKSKVNYESRSASQPRGKRSPTLVAAQELPSHQDSIRAKKSNNNNNLNSIESYYGFVHTLPRYNYPITQSWAGNFAREDKR